MRVTKAFRFELDPSVQQRIALAKHVGTARFAYNWGLALCLKALEERKKIPSAVELHKEWNRWKREHAPWWQEVSKCAPQEAFRDLERAFRNWKKGRAQLPRFKRKRLALDNAARLTGSIVVFPRHVQLPRIGKIRSKESTEKLLRFIGEGKARVLSATIRREANRWYVSLTCEGNIPDPKSKDIQSGADVVGIDLGLFAFAVFSDGTQVAAPKPLARKLKLLKRRSQQFSRKQKGSNNQRKAALQLARLHRKIKNLRLDFLHQLTTWLAKTKPVLVVEDLNIRGLSRGWLSRSVADVGWGSFRRLLAYKAEWYGARLITVPRSFPSTRLCSCCGHLHPRLPLSQREFRCAACGFVLDRDLNAALNLGKYGLAHLKGSTASSAGSDACGDRLCGGTASGRSPSTRSWKQEVAGHLGNSPG
jgi:putative transposase